MVSNVFFTAANESELNDLVAGRRAGSPVPWHGHGQHTANRLKAGSTGVIWTDTGCTSGKIQPLLLIARSEDHRRLFGRFAQLRSDLSPLSVWCHLITPERFEPLDSLTRDAHLSGFEAAWTGLIVAEALLLTERPISKLRLQACLATQSFGVARTTALWDSVSLDEVLDRFDVAQRLVKTSEARTTRLRAVFRPIWTCLRKSSSPSALLHNTEYYPIIKSLRVLSEARTQNVSNEAHEFSASLREVVPEAGAFETLGMMSAEQRLREFDRLVDILDATDRNADPIRIHCLALLAGYLSTVAAGGAPSLSLTEAVSLRWPEITAWAYLTGGVGEHIVWTSAFDGLGRLVARELMRPLRLDERPTCDFSLDEAAVLVDSKLSDPLVHLRIKQARIISVSLFPGVNIPIPIADSSQEFRKPESIPESRRQQNYTQAGPGNELLARLADAIWPYLHERIQNIGRPSENSRLNAVGSKPKRGRVKNRAPQRDLPLKGADKK